MECCHFRSQCTYSENPSSYLEYFRKFLLDRPSELDEEIPVFSLIRDPVYVNIRENVLHLGIRGLTTGLPGSRASLCYTSHGFEGIKDLSLIVLFITHTWRQDRDLLKNKKPQYLFGISHHKFLS